MVKRRDLVFLLVLATLLFSPCRRPPGVKGLGLSVSFSDRALTDNLFTDITFRFRTGPSFAGFADSLEVFADLRHRGLRLAGDAFLPDVPATDWQPGREYTFTRRFYIPAFINEFSPDFKGYEIVELQAGLRPPGPPEAAPGQAVQEGPPPAAAVGRPLEMFSRRLRVLPAPAFPAIVHLSGWYPPEPEAGNPARTVRWISAEASCIVDNPGRDGLLVIRGVTGEAAPPGQTVTVSIDGRQIGRFTPEGGRFDRSYDVPERWLDGGRDFILTIAVDKTFVPARVIPGSADERELGVGITLLYFR